MTPVTARPFVALTFGLAVWSSADAPMTTTEVPTEVPNERNP